MCIITLAVVRVPCGLLRVLVAIVSSLGNGDEHLPVLFSVSHFLTAAEVFVIILVQIVVGMIGFRETYQVSAVPPRPLFSLLHISVPGLGTCLASPTPTRLLLARATRESSIMPAGGHSP